MAQNVERLNPQGITNTCGALVAIWVGWGKLETQELNDCLLDAVRYNAEQFNSQQIANTL
ncbi:DUF1601 domain-containing protein [Coxiella endosymbiont of Ornithodoros maritimus]|uniref:DUF1601 domain-containing protein n=1 Tax=Coxiella endosymbiont of Ornithodoros maritimus TaxID=1656172 RepID=UPI003899273F